MAHRVAYFCIAAVLVGNAVLTDAQISMQPTPPPDGTAENEAWYASGEAITVGGHLYYPSGPIIHFNSNEMVPSGRVGNVFIYTRTTQEPGSIFYVPLPGGLVRPYERRRDGDLAGTVGSTAPAFPVVHPAAESGDAAPLREAAPPTGDPVGLIGHDAAPADADPARPLPSSDAVTGTSGTALPEPGPPHPRVRLSSARKPVGLNGIFVDFEDGRWFSAGPAVPFDDRFTQVGKHGAFPVYSRKGKPGTIYIPAVTGASTLMAPYRAH